MPLPEHHHAPTINHRGKQVLVERVNGPVRPNPPMQPTPLRGPKIGAFLKAGFGPTVFPIYTGRRG